MTTNGLQPLPRDIYGCPSWVPYEAQEIEIALTLPFDAGETVKPRGCWAVPLPDLILHLPGDSAAAAPSVKS